jgi:hypothetical protein
MGNLTKVQFDIMGYTGDRYGWGRLTTESTRQDALEQLRCYRENAPGMSYRLRTSYAILPEHESTLRATLERINMHYGRGDLVSVDFAEGIAVCRKQYGSDNARFTLLDGDRVRFRGVVRKIGYVPIFMR